MRERGKLKVREMKTKVGRGKEVEGGGQINVLMGGRQGVSR
jgi:hypothetical protein